MSFLIKNKSIYFVLTLLLPIFFFSGCSETESPNSVDKQSFSQDEINKSNDFETGLVLASSTDNFEISSSNQSNVIDPEVNDSDDNTVQNSDIASTNNESSLTGEDDNDSVESSTESIARACLILDEQNCLLDKSCHPFEGRKLNSEQQCYYSKDFVGCYGNLDVSTMITYVSDPKENIWKLANYYHYYPEGWSVITDNRVILAVWNLPSCE